MMRKIAGLGDAHRKRYSLVVPCVLILFITCFTAALTVGTSMLVIPPYIQTEKVSLANPFNWPEMKEANNWSKYNQPFADERFNGRYILIGYKEASSGFLLYKIFIDPGRDKPTSKAPYPWPVLPATPDALHNQYRLLIHTIKSDAKFGAGIRLVFGNDVKMQQIQEGQLLSDKARATLTKARLRQTAIDTTAEMKAIAADRKRPAQVRAWALLLAGLVAGGADGNAPPDRKLLARIPKQFPQERLTAFNSEYYIYLCEYQDHKRHTRSAQEIYNRYRKYTALKNTSAWRFIVSQMEEQQISNRSRLKSEGR
jgi:hypothetical protein